MSVRAVAVAGLCALLCAPASAKPRKKRGPLAAYIDPTAPDDPPRTVPKSPNALSIVLLYDRSAPLGSTPTRAWSIENELWHELQRDDLVALMTFDTTTDVVVKPVFVNAYGNIQRAVVFLSPGREDHDVAAALDDARAYIKCAPNRRLIVLVTDRAVLDDKLLAATAAIRAEQIDVIVATPGAANPDPLQFIAKSTLGVYVDLAGRNDLPTEFERAIRALR